MTNPKPTNRNPVDLGAIFDRICLLQLVELQIVLFCFFSRFVDWFLNGVLVFPFSEGNRQEVVGGGSGECSSDEREVFICFKDRKGKKR